MKHFYILISLFLLLGVNNKLMAQQKKITVKGTVVDREDKQTLLGVTILTGTPLTAIGVTNVNGEFTVIVNDNATLVFRFIGYKNLTQNVAGKTKLNVALSPQSNALTEVTVQGYQTRTKETTVGASTSISGKEIQDVPVANLTDLLQGKVAGLNIQNNNGAPGARGSITFRGVSNINVSGSGNSAYLTPTTPLFVIDGIPVDDNASYQYGFQQAGPGISPISLIPPEDVASIEVLKDASATSLYGSRGAYGVILITTKRGNSKIPVVRYTNNFFVNTVPQLRAVIGGKDERLIRISEIIGNDTSYYHALNTVNKTEFLSDSLNAYYNNSTDWQSYFYQPTFNQTHNLNISGGDQKFNYKTDLGYYDEKGIQANTGFSRYNLNMNMQYQPNTKFKMYAAINNTLGKQQKGSGNGLVNTGVAAGGGASSLLPAPSQFTAVNEVLGAIQTDNDNKTVNVNTTLELQYEIVKGLRATTTGNYTYNTGTEDNFLPAAINNNVSQLYTYNDRSTKLYNRNLLSYDITLNAAHSFSAYVFSELNMSNFKADALINNKVVNDNLRGPIVGTSYPYSLGGTLNNFTDARSVALAGNFSYNYMRKYVLTLSYRFDGNSTNGPDAGYTKSPAIGFRWNFDKEKWLANVNWLDYGSIRLSYGSNIVPNGTIYDVYGKYLSGSLYNNKPTVNIDLTRSPNLNLQPTINTTYNAGFDLGLLKNRINLSYNMYYKQVDNIFRSKDIANINSFGEVTTNQASLVDYGYELELSVNVFPDNSKFKWSISPNIAINHDVLTGLPDDVRQLIEYDNSATGQATYLRLGLNSLSNFLYNTKGVYTSNNAVPVDPLTGLRYRTGGKGSLNYFKAGDPIYTDVNGDYVLDQNDLVVVGNSQARVTGGISSFAQYKNFTLNVSTTFTLGRDILNNALADQFRQFSNPTSVDKNGNRTIPQGLVPLSEYNIWKASGTNGTYPNPYDYIRAGIINPYRYNQTLFQEDGSYFKIGTITLGYIINRKFTQRMGINSIRVFGTAYNVATFSNYSGPNPEAVSDLGRDISGGYPVARKYTLGLNIEF
jgi:TonB-linked SusC/RagA family outer membrane protein